MKTVISTTLPMLQEVISRQDAAKQLGISTQTLRNYELEPNGLTCAKIGGAVYYRIADLEAFLAARFRQPNPIRRKAG